MHRWKNAVAAAAWYAALWLLYPGINTYWRFLAFGADVTPAAPVPILLAYGVIGCAVVLAFLLWCRQRWFVLFVFAASLLVKYAIDQTPTIDRILGFLTVMALAAICLEFIRQNTPLYRSLKSARMPIAAILLRTALLWSPALIFIGIGLYLNHLIVESSKRAIYGSGVIEEYCSAPNDPAAVPCRARSGEVVRLSREEGIARRVRELFLVAKKQQLLELEDLPTGQRWRSEKAVSDLVGMLESGLRPAAVLGLPEPIAGPQQRYANDPEIQELSAKLRLVESELARLDSLAVIAPPRALVGTAGLAISAALARANAMATRQRAFQKLQRQKSELTDAIRLRRQALEKEEQERDPAAFEAALIARAAHELLANADALARKLFTDFRNDVLRQMEDAAMPPEMIASMRVNVIRAAYQIEGETRRALQSHPELAYKARLARPLCRLRAPMDDNEHYGDFDCSDIRSGGGSQVVRLSLRKSIDQSIDRWQHARERQIEDELIASGLIAAKTTNEIKSRHAKLWEGDQPLPRTIGLGIRPCGFLDVGCWIANKAKKSAEQAYANARENLRRNSVASLNNSIDQGQKSVAEQIDLARSELYAATTEARRALDAAVEEIFKAGAVASALLTLWLALAIVKSLLYVLATEIFHAKGASDIGLDALGRAQGTYDVSDSIEIPPSDSTPLYTVVVGANQTRRAALPQPAKAMLTRIFRRKWVLNHGTHSGKGSMKFAQPGGHVGINWKMRAGEEVVFEYRHLLGFSENVALQRTISLRLSTLLFGRYIYHSARSVGGPGRLLLSVRGQVEKQTARIDTFPLEMLIAWNKHARFRIHDSRTFGAVFKDGFTVARAPGSDGEDGLILIGASSEYGPLIQGTIRFTKVFLMPF